MNNPIDSLLEELKEITAARLAQQKLDEDLGRRTTAADKMIREIMSSPDSTDEDRQRVVDAVADFVAEAQRAAIKSAFLLRDAQARASGESVDDEVTEPELTVPAGFPRLS